MNRLLSNHWFCVFAILFCVDFFYQQLISSGSLVDTLKITAFEAVTLTTIYFVCTQKNIFKTSVVFLFIPYLFFIPGWLNLPTAIVMGGITVFCLFRTLSTPNSLAPISCDGKTLGAFLLIVCYINLSGSGGYGYQSPDFSMHNSRLSDLITLNWPIQYEGNKHLVYYMGYFLPAAMIGTFSSYEIASYFLYFWSIFGMTLVFRWLQHLSGWHLTIWLVLPFMLFGSLDILNTFFIHVGGEVSPENILFPLDIGRFEFINREAIGFFLGNYLSHTLQLYFAPHQVIAGWIGMGLLAHLYLSRQPGQMLFIFSLLSLWSPFVMLGMGAMMMILLMDFARKDWRPVITLENTLGAFTVCLLFIIYYLGGSSERNPSINVLASLDTLHQYLALLILLIAGWGIYSVMILPYLHTQDSSQRWLFGGLITSLALLPLWTFGAYNDLFCRGSAPLMFLLMVFLLKATKYYRENKKPWLLCAIAVLFIAGSLSALQQHTKSVIFYGNIQAPSTVTRFKYGWENLGPDQSVFGKYFRAATPDN